MASEAYAGINTALIGVPKKERRRLNHDIYPDESRPGITNLFTILSAMENRPLNELAEEVRGYTPKMFKERVAESVIKGLSDVARSGDTMR
jgi:hypothetical protein